MWITTSAFHQRQSQHLKFVHEIYAQDGRVKGTDPLHLQGMSGSAGHCGCHGGSKGDVPSSASVNMSAPESSRNLCLIPYKVTGTCQHLSANAWTVLMGYSPLFFFTATTAR